MIDHIFKVFGQQQPLSNSSGIHDAFRRGETQQKEEEEEEAQSAAKIGKFTRWAATNPETTKSLARSDGFLVKKQKMEENGNKENQQPENPPEVVSNFIFIENIWDNF